MGCRACKRRRPVERPAVCPHTALLICMSIHTLCHLCPSPATLPRSHTRQANKPGQAFIFGLVVRFSCTLWHPLISLIPIWYRIIDTARLHANSGVLWRGETAAWTSMPTFASPSRPLALPPLFLSLSRLQHLHAELLFHVDYITAHRTHTQARILSVTLFCKHSLGLLVDDEEDSFWRAVAMDFTVWKSALFLALFQSKR